MDKLKQTLQTRPYFLLLLPAFFFLHGFIENYHYAMAGQSLLLWAKYSFISLVMAGFWWLVFRDRVKASVATIFLLSFHFFFGSTHDFLKKYFADSFIVRYSFIISVTVLLLAVLVLYLKKTKANLTRICLFLNCLFLLLLIPDIFSLLKNITRPKPQYVAGLGSNFNACENCSNPDIYLVIADEYAGDSTLRSLFSFDNSEFRNELKQRGFHLTNNSASNYNATVYSMASMFSMDYIESLEKNIVNHRDMFVCRALIKDNNLLHFLKVRGYRTYNFSPFDFDNHKNFVVTPFFASRQSLITAQTFLNRFWRDMGYNFVSEATIRKAKEKHLFNNEKIEAATRKAAAENTGSPKFVYTHIALPHHPYYYDSAGNRTPYNSTTHSFPDTKTDYIQYMHYSNRKLLSIIDHIRAVSAHPPVIILMSDHGYRQYTEPTDPYHYFTTLNAVLLPGGNYSAFYDGMTNVNQFRVLLNTQFGQQLPLLKDSTSFLIEP